MLEFLKKGVFKGTDEFLEQQSNKLILKTSEKTFDSPSFDVVIDEIDKISENATRNYEQVKAGKKTYFVSLEYVGKSFIQATFIRNFDECLYHIEYMKDISDCLVKSVDDVDVSEVKNLFKSFYENKPLNEKLEWEDLNI
ncbi:hypothetical protein [uncultured Finegoldia sp.]|uniref:hypothetical protein n=1 Tax=uncultured Finegoldia sp. TaxID=328009 RepID=UPI002606B1F8|nr:hypothetical protein [uncultured Finegoldia sp.]